MSREFDELLSAYLDGEVSPEERAAVERRLEQSPQLRETLDELSEVGDLIRGLPKPRAPIDLPERVVAAISPRPLASAAIATKKHRLFGTWPLVATGTVLAACVTIVVLMPRQPNVENLAVNAPRSGPEPTIATTSDGSDPYELSGGAARTALAIEAGRSSGDRTAETAESLTEYLRKLGRKPIPGEVYKTLEDNAGRTLVRQYTVVDTSEVANRMRTILINNSMNVIETETPLPRAGFDFTNDSSGKLVIYVEGPPQQVDRALDELESLSAVREVRDLGVLADSDSEPATTELFFDSAGKPTTDFGFITPKETPGDQPAPEAKPPASDPTPALEPAARFATNGVADAERAKEAKLGDRLDLKAAEVQNAPTPAPAMAGAARGELERRSTSVASQPATNFLGVSTQLDSNAPIVQDVLRSRAYGNSVSGNAAQGAAAPGNSAQRSAAGQFQDNFWRFKNLQQSNEDLNRKLNEAGVGQQQDKTDAGKEVMLKQQAGTAGRTAAGSPVEFEAVVANPQAVPSQVHLLLILEPQAPQPAAPPAVTAPTPAKKAGD